MTECFDDHFPCNKEEYDRNHVNNWLKLFILYLHIRTDKFQLMGFLMESGKVNGAVLGSATLIITGGNLPP